MTKVAVVTGSSKGIGIEIVRGLCKKFDGDVYLTARNVEQGTAALEELKKEGLKVNFHPLDIENVESIKTLAKYLKDKYGGLDVLINNAAIAFRLADNTTPFHIQAEATNKVNYFATINVCKILLPLLKSHARVVNMSSRGGLLKIIKNESIRKKLLDKNTTVDDVSEIITQFLNATKENKHESLGFPKTSYGMSKLGVTAATFALQREVDSDKTRSDIVVNACCPGYTPTGLSNFTGSLTVDQASETPLYLALLPPNVSEPRGQFVFEKKIFDWSAE